MSVSNDLRQAVLQAAIQGKLTKQLPEDGNAKDLLEQIKAEKAKLIKEGKLKKEKPLPEITEDEIPFDIPENWEWVRWGDISFSIQYGYNAPAKPNGRIKMVRISDIQDNGVVWETVPYCDIEESEIPNYLLKRNDILFARTGGTVGKSYLVKDVEEAVYAGYLICTRYSSLLSPEYLKYFMGSNLYWKQLRSGTIATAQPNCNGKTLANMLIPLPPLSEQKRIVAKVEELLARIDELEKTEKELEALKKAFPADMKASLLQAAMQGKLTEQLPEDGNAKDLLEQIKAEKAKLIKEGKLKKEKPLPAITEDEKPFDIPENWEWVRLNQVLDVRDGTHDTPKYVSVGVPLVTSKNLCDGTIDFEKAKLISFEDAEAINVRSNVEDGDILFAMIGSIGNPVLVKKDREFSIKNMALFKPLGNDFLVMKYLLLFLEQEQQNMKRIASGGVQSFVSLGFLRSYAMPLPPLAEQKRIVEKLGKLLPLCDGLEG